MPLVAGSKIGPYEIFGPLGAGGMGEVYRAHDPRLGREVAIKILPSNFSLDADRLQRFEQEARAAGILNHPNILSVHDIGRVDGSPYLVTELLEGETLRVRLEHGPLPQRKAVDYGLQIAQGLSAAHEKGIVHRDLKPENLFITKDGRVKILDFGLAKLTQNEAPLAEVTHLPTSPGTQPGVILGTMGYMSPEQVRGQQADHRSDIFSLGVILYEMLTGKKAFHGNTAADTMSAILQKDPQEITQITSNVSPALVRIAEHCLEKNPEQRFQSSSDIAFNLQSLSGISDTTAGAAVLAQRRAIPLYLWKILAIAASLVAVLFFILYYRIHSKPVDAYHISMEMPDKWTFELFRGGLTLSPDGRYLAFVAVSDDGRNHIWLRSLAQSAPQLLSDTEDGQYPFWSPDSQYLAFFTIGKLKKIKISGGSAQTICETPDGRGGTWNQDGIIVFAPQPYGGLKKVSSAGGNPEPVTQTSGPKVSHRWPSFLPDGSHFLYLSDEPMGICLASLNSKETKVLIPSVYTNAVYAEPGYLLFFREGNLVAQPFDANHLKFSGEAFPVIEEKVNYAPLRGVTAFSVSQNGILAYQPEGPTLTRLVWLDSSGKEIGSAAEETYDRGLGAFGFIIPRISPDGSKVSLRRWDRNAGKYDLWILESSTKQFTRFTVYRDVEDAGVWSPDESRIAYTSNRTMFIKTVSGGAPEQRLIQEDRDFHPFSWSPDGKLILYQRQNAAGDGDICAIPVSGSQKPIVVLATPAIEASPTISPDGKWLAYTSDATGLTELYVCAFPGCNRQWKISTGGANFQFWRKDERELYYISQNRLMVVKVTGTSSEFQFSPPTLLFTMPRNTLVDVSPDGRFLAAESVLDVSQNFLRLLIHWPSTLK